MSTSLTTLIFELVNFLVLVVVLHRLVYRPLRDAILARRQKLDDDRAAVEEEGRALAATRAELDEGQRGLEALRAEVRREAVEEAQQERTRILEQARQDAAGERARVQALLDSERKAAEDWVRTTAVEKATFIAGRMLQQMAPDAVERALREGLVDAIARQGDRLREQGRNGPLEVELTGVKLPGDEVVATLREALEKVLRVRPQITAREDETIGAGLVLRVEDVVLDASLGGQLAAYRDLAESFVER